MFPRGRKKEKRGGRFRAYPFVVLCEGASTNPALAARGCLGPHAVRERYLNQQGDCLMAGYTPLRQCIQHSIIPIHRKYLSNQHGSAMLTALPRSRKPSLCTKGFDRFKKNCYIFEHHATIVRREYVSLVSHHQTSGCPRVVATPTLEEQRPRKRGAMDKE